MMDRLRRLYNTADRFFDRRALTQDVGFVRQLKHPSQTLTARQALAVVLPAAKELDSKLRLKLMAAPHGVNPDGTAVRWEFFFHLLTRRAKLECGWFLAWDPGSDEFGSPYLEVRARPFPLPDNVIRDMVSEGKLLYRQLLGLWQQERRQKPDLPFQFRDTDEVVAELVRQGLDVVETELSFATGQSPTGQLSWVALTRTGSYYVNLQ